MNYTNIVEGKMREMIIDKVDSFKYLLISFQQITIILILPAVIWCMAEKTEEGPSFSYQPVLPALLLSSKFYPLSTPCNWLQVSFF